ncbi:DUF805 domain-containing protein [Jejuia spongiicola]|uniref:DUF805 domain-containing protein n=1 Tax=Jejuia spongiicola TaxID=2942207 RepID=A0ABT0QBD7_9FLAO|nr:DUF805 domain-containing protein [Jejuia spongiicola]MCL6294296.1 DUF805 domain-containing protein [Jejuia spongiicola]
MKWFKKVLIENYANFSGRARRQEYWMYALFWSIIVISMSILAEYTEKYLGFTWGFTFFIIFSIATLIPWLAVNVRRLHDTGKSGGYFFVNFIPLIGRIWYLILVCTDGESGPNQYGPDPKKPNINDEIDDIGKPLLDE